MHHIVIPAITLGVYVLRRTVKKLPPKALPWISALGGLLCAVFTGDANVRGMVEGAVEGLAASGLWGAVGKHIAPGGGTAGGEAAQPVAPVAEAK